MHINFARLLLFFIRYIRADCCYYGANILHSRNFLIYFVALHATAQEGTSSMQGSTWMTGDIDINSDPMGGYMALLTTPPPDPTQQSQTDNQEVESTQYYRAAPNRYGWTTPPPRGPPRAPRHR
jgi:hypothetical protein